MSLNTNVYFFRSEDEPRLHRRDVIDAIVARLPETEQRQRIAAHGAIRVALNEFDWLFNRGGARTLLDPPVEAFLVAVRRIGDAPVYVTPLDLIRRYHALGWIPEERLCDLPPEALEPPREQDAISLDHVLMRFHPTGPDAGPNRVAALLERAEDMVAAIHAHVAEQTARHGDLDDEPDASSHDRTGS